MAATMIAAGGSATLPEDVAARGASLTLPLFAAALFLSAFLLFGVEPMFTKMVLPSLGGTPAVWSIAMVFFQGVLLIGYCYAHFLARLADLRIATLVHIALMVAALCLMPIGLDAGWGRPPASGEALWLLRAFAAAVGLPFLAVAANGPLLQAWFARSGHRAAGDPYFLYGASNIGSFTALVAYPLLIEPSLSLRQQSLAWTWGFAGLAAAITACALVARAGGRDRPPPSQAEAAAGPAAWRRRLVWIGLAAVPSGLLLAVTAHISTDVAAAPLLWIVPLALFLLTFVLVFRAPPLVDPARLPLVFVILAALAWIVAPTANSNFVLGLGIHLGLFFVAALGAHATLYAARPKARQLTEFYVCMSFGGMLGGLFCGLVAPHVFTTVLEYPLLIAAAFFCRPHLLGGGRDWARDAIIVLTATIAAWLVADAATGLPFNPLDARSLRIALLAIAATLAWREALRCALFGAAMAVAFVLPSGQDANVTTLRSFFGVHKIYDTPDRRFRILTNGTTIHGAMRIRNENGTPATGRPEPLTYYAKGGSVADAIEAVRTARGGLLRRVTVIGLGTGSLACARRDGEAWTFLEIDPVVVSIAGNPAMFRFLSACGARPPIVLGDARLTLADRDARSDLIVVDAFSSDAIPTHLLTAEAMALYRSRLEADGAIAFHISNRHLGLKQILARVAAANGLATYYRHDQPRPRATEADLFAPSEVVLVTHDIAGIGGAATTRGWARIEPDTARPAWTDDYSNILEAILDRAKD